MINQLRKISIIHAIRCYKTTNFAEATISFHYLRDLTNEILENNVLDDEKVLSLMNLSPKVTETEISECLVNNKNSL